MSPSSPTNTAIAENPHNIVMRLTANDQCDVGRSDVTARYQSNASKLTPVVSSRNCETVRHATRPEVHSAETHVVL